MNAISLHQYLLKNGLKVKAETNTDNTDVTIYENEEFYIIVEEKIVTPTKVKEAISKPQTSHPVTGDITPEQAKELLFNATRSK